MNAAVLERYGAPEEALVVRDVPVPEPGSEQVRVRVHVTTVTAGDAEIRSLALPWLFRLPIRLWLGWRRPERVLGMEVAGVIDAVGSQVTDFAVGDAVFGATGMHFGAYAERALVDTGAEGLVAKIPEGVAFDDVAPLPIGGLAALGYNPGPANNIRGDLLEAAVRQFQRDYGLAVDGLVTAELVRSIEFRTRGG